MNNIKFTLEELYDQMPDPFQMTEKESLKLFFNLPAARKIYENEEASINQLLDFIKRNPENASLIKIAVLVLSQFEPTLYYNGLLSLLGEGNQNFVEAFDLGIWQVDVAEEKIVQDLFQLVKTTDNPFILLLLQRPAAGTVKNELRKIIAQGRLPHSLYAMFCYKYILQLEDVEWLSQIAGSAGDVLVNALAGIYLLSLNSSNGLEAISLGLGDANIEIRRQTYYELLPHISDHVRIQAEYNSETRFTKEDTHELLIGIKK